MDQIVLDEGIDVTDTRNPNARTETALKAGLARGTEIATERGPVAVEDLKVGERIVTFRGLKPLRRLTCSRFVPGREENPVLLRSGSALGNSRDLYVSPAQWLRVQDWHAQALFGAGEVLVSARDLVNGRTISEVSVAVITYYHLNFDAQEMVQAEGCWCECAGMRAVRRGIECHMLPTLSAAETRALI
ncbi:Hint domain-containing protein [Algicella marina]|nr:Hint domain-containing protein [Algicella marina]